MQKKVKSRSQVVTVLKSLSRNKMAILGLVILILLTLMAIFAPYIAPMTMRSRIWHISSRPPAQSIGSAQMSSAAMYSAASFTVHAYRCWSVSFPLALPFWLAALSVRLPASMASGLTMSSCESWMFCWRFRRPCWPSPWPQRSAADCLT